MIFDAIFKRRACDLCVVHFYRGIDEEGYVRPFHRGIFVVEDPDTSPQRGILYHLALYGGRLWRLKKIDDMRPTIAVIISVMPKIHDN